MRSRHRYAAPPPVSVAVGDSRFLASYARVREAEDRAGELRRMTDEEVIEALAAASRVHDALLANVLATESLNRVRRLRASLEHLGEGVVTLALDGRIHWLNLAAERLLGWPRDEVIGKEFHALVDHRAEDRSPLARDASPLFPPQGPGAIDAHWFRRKDRSWACVAARSAYLLTDGEPQGLVITVRDCEEERTRERALQESEQRYRSLFENSPEAIVSIATDGTVLDANPAAEELTRTPLAHARGRPFSSFVHPSDEEEVWRLFAEVVKGEARRATIRVVRADGVVVAADAMGVPIVVDGEVVGVHGVLRDAS